MGSNPVGVTKTREHSSAGRALALQARCHRFESYCSHQNKESTEKSVLFWFERTVGENLYSSPLAEDGKKKQKKKKNYLFPSERQGSAYGRFLCSAKVLPTAGSYCSHQNKESTEKSVLFWFERTVGENLYSSPLAEDGKKKQKKKNNYLFPSECGTEL